jgi:hypothetical protein
MKLDSSFFPDNACSGHTRFVRTILHAKLVHSFLTTQPLRPARPGHTRFVRTKLRAKIVHSFPMKDFPDNTATLATLTVIYAVLSIGDDRNSRKSI